MTLIFLRRAGVILLLFVSFGTNRATAGPLALFLITDPATTAGFGVPTVPRADSTGTFSVTSNKSGPGSFHVYAVDDVQGSFGISYFSIALTNTVSIYNRSPTGGFDTLNDQGGSVTGGDGSAGFSDGLLRSGNNQKPLQGAQVIGSLNRIGGMGQTANNLNNTPNLPAVPAGGSRSWSGVTSGAWGNYATDPAMFDGKSWLLLGEGNYSGQVPRIDYNNSEVFYYSDASFQSQAPANIGDLCLPTVCFPPTVQDVDVNNVIANDPGLLTLTMSVVSPPPRNFTWRNLTFDSYVPAGGASGTGPATPATLSGNQFSWNTVGSPLGTYKWFVTAAGGDGADTGSITVHITAVPEPATVSLFGIALVIICNRNRHRR